ncbi:MAG: aminomethyl-transferring glycine dehydrogenase subunit GcvPB [Candidatus Marinimicrobia bacterium]|jgi:glycine dehydrogenase subunit 2|nr:aminomethyl-transferring glycine dehydrogenase subunit GcvPB [Candidatus Neomarinimicrobiota bacterium]MCK9558887.1 aminomethyl-transferring glycine dehydrogenase subunit GcvPB [Candidatus Neomarinimicrobiota bacterium]MDD5062418.1 aminomethyl-transferring glycine dehydrogenase subunit GcvPB [Candidatus Neomarinimicrobiota bacterium]
MMEKLIFEYTQTGKMGVSLPGGVATTVAPKELIPSDLMRRSELKLPEVSEPEVVRHFTNLSSMNHHVDKDFYPLGSCTMKYNPKINERCAALSGLANCHPLQDEDTVQGALEILYEVERYLCAITGMQAATLQPAAGSHGELTGVLLIKKYLEMKGETRRFILIPDSAHGTNPSSAASANYQTISLKSNSRGCIDLEDLRSKMNESVAGLMLTNPNTLGLFEEEVGEIVKIVHDRGGLVYMDGANLNALLGIVRPGDMGFDITHINLHKTFSTPHGGGGPGSGVIAVNAKLADFLPVPRVAKNGERYHLRSDCPNSIGRVLGFYGNFGVIVRAYCYIRMLGTDGLQAVSRNAILNANYLRYKLSPIFDIPYNRVCMHEFVASGERQFKRSAVKTLDIAKRLLDFGFHAPTVYFPLIVKEALMIEPTETESKETIDRFVAVLLKIDQESQENPDILHQAPTTTPVRRLDELKANKELNVCWSK